MEVNLQRAPVAGSEIRLHAAEAVPGCLLRDARKRGVEAPATANQGSALNAVCKCGQQGFSVPKVEPRITRVAQDYRVLWFYFAAHCAS